MTKAIGLASDEGAGYGDDGQSDFAHHQAMRAKLLGFGYTTVYEFYDGSQGGTDASGNPSASIISPAVNSGVGLFNYTGHGDLTTCITGNYGSNHVNQATNNGKYPFVISVACNNGTFTSGTCISETWMRATNSGSPTGSIATCGSSILMAWAEPMETQDEMTEIIAESYSNNKKISLGGIFYNAQYSMLEDYNASTNAKEVMQTWVMFGDPSTLFRNKVTQDLTASHVAHVELGETSVNITCNVEGAKIAITRPGGAIIGTGLVTGGIATINFPALAINTPLIVIGTKQNYKPYQGSITVADGEPAGVSVNEANIVNVYPNPSTDFVNVAWNGVAPQTIQVMDLSGKVVYNLSQNQLSGTLVVIPTIDLSSGIYLLNVTRDNNINTVKLTVK
jgi:gingipain R